MNAAKLLSVLCALAMILGLPASVRATGQVSDIVRFKGTDRWMVECPLNYLLATLPEHPEFDWTRTSNYKGYTAAWEVKDGALFLVSFEAERDKKAIPLEAILPDRKLPVRADWYSGRIRIPIGRPIEGSGDGLWATFERVMVLHIDKGKVVKEEDLKNFRIKSPSEERAAERARHWLWPFPKLPQGTVIAPSAPLRMKKKVCLVVVSPEVMQRTPAWSNDGTEPPVSRDKAKQLAEAKSRQLLGPRSKFTWKVDKSSLECWSKDRHYYEFLFLPHPPEAASTRDPPWLKLLVLMDGTVPEPTILDLGDWVGAARAGAFNVAKALTGIDTEYWKLSDYGTPWPQLSWRSRLSLMVSIAAAPKLLYEIHKLEVYSNGLWAEYSITNWSDKPTYYHTDYLNIPLRNVGLWDGAGEKWIVPELKESNRSENLQHYSSVEPRQTVRYRALISHKKGRQLQPFGLLENRKSERPKALDYFIAAWPTAATKLTESRDSEVQVFAFGYGRVPVTWFDKDYPADWPLRTRLSGSKAAK